MLQMKSTVSADGQVSLCLAEVDTPTLSDRDVLIRVEATPINPSDLGLLFGGADVATIGARTVDGRPGITATVPPAALADSPAA